MFKQNKNLHGCFWGFFSLDFLVWAFLGGDSVVRLDWGGGLVIGLIKLQKTEKNKIKHYTSVKMIMQNSRLLAEKNISSDSCTHSSKGRTYSFEKVNVFSKTNFF